MRHGIAEDFSENAPDDFGRALTAKGRKRARRAALGLKKLVPQLDFLASSPKVRARQTAQIAREAWGENAPPLTEWGELMEEDFGAWLEKLRALRAETVLLCGHQPILGRVASQFLTGSADALEIRFKKAGVCALEVELDLPSARLLWHLGARALREIGG